MDYYEKLIWGQFVPLFLGCGYFAFAASQGGGWPVISIIFVSAVAQVVYYILLAALSRKEPRDERMRLIELKAFKVAYVFVMVAICFWVAATKLHLLNVLPQAATAMFLAVWFGIEAVRTGTQVGMYRASVRS